MGTEKLRGIVQEILKPAGIAINGSSPSDMHINDERFFGRVLRDGSIGLGESFMDCWWCDRLDEFFCKLMPLQPEKSIKKNLKLHIMVLRAVLFNLAGSLRAFAIGERHYDLGNELFRRMLDKRMVYSCGLRRNAGNLDQAQESKAGADLQEAGASAGGPGAGYRLRVGKFCEIRGRAIRCDRYRYYRFS
jgi:cyclopropane-fatty-acyl-phospholipid synthase